MPFVTTDNLFAHYFSKTNTWDYWYYIMILYSVYYTHRGIRTKEKGYYLHLAVKPALIAASGYK